MTSDLTPDPEPASGSSRVRSVQAYGDEALLVRAQRTADVPALLATIDDLAATGHTIVEAHPGEQAILVRIRANAEPMAVEELARTLKQLDATSHRVEPGRIVLPVRYDGEDLVAVTDAVGASAEAVIAMHSSAEYEVAFCGFSPGFAYLRGLPSELHLPRRDSPRGRVPAGSLAIAAHYCAVYPTQSPGGWHLIGSCDTQLFDPVAAKPFVLQPGTTVRFEPTR